MMTTTARPIAKVKSFVPGAAEAKEINEDHEALQEGFANLTDRQVRLGEKLEKIKKAMGGHFERWVEKHLDFCVRTARRYMAKARVKRTELSDLKACASLNGEPSLVGDIPEKTPARRPLLKLFSAAAVKVLNKPIEEISSDDKITILRDYERFEPIALQLVDRPSVFALAWQKKMLEPPVRWTRKDVALLKAEIDKAQAVLAALEDDALFDATTSTNSATVIDAVAIEGDAP